MTVTDGGGAGTTHTWNVTFTGALANKAIVPSPGLSGASAVAPTTPLSGGTTSVTRYHDDIRERGRVEPYSLHHDARRSPATRRSSSACTRRLARPATAPRRQPEPDLQGRRRRHHRYPDHPDPVDHRSMPHQMTARFYPSASPLSQSSACVPCGRPVRVCGLLRSRIRRRLRSRRRSPGASHRCQTGERRGAVGDHGVDLFRSPPAHAGTLQHLPLHGHLSQRAEEGERVGACAPRREVLRCEHRARRMPGSGGDRRRPACVHVERRTTDRRSELLRTRQRDPGSRTREAVTFNTTTFSPLNLSCTGQEPQVDCVFSTSADRTCPSRNDRLRSDHERASGRQA